MHADRLCDIAERHGYQVEVVGSDSNIHHITEGRRRNTDGTDIIVTRSPTIRDIVNSEGVANGPFMHIGVSINLNTVLTHYNSIVVGPANNNIDPRLVPGGNPQQLNLTQEERDAVIAFMETLSGSDVYTNEKWSNPFIN